jgi:hypothetical protein
MNSKIFSEDLEPKGKTTSYCIKNGEVVEWTVSNKRVWAIV